MLFGIRYLGQVLRLYRQQIVNSIAHNELSRVQQRVYGRRHGMA